MRVHSYVKAGGSNRYSGSSIQVTEAFKNYVQALDMIRSWITVKTNQVLFTKLEAVENEMILGIERVIRLNNISDDHQHQLLNFCLTQAEVYRSVTIEKQRQTLEF